MITVERTHGHITVEERTDLEGGKVKFQEWGFWWNEMRHCLVLDKYRCMILPSKRHKHGTLQANYSRLNSRSISPHGLMPEDVPIPPVIRDTVLATWRNEITIERRQER
jgi:hypothetical protein